jgi:hypothetical protein
MADSSLFGATTLDRIGDLLGDTAGVRDLPPSTTLLVWTMHSRYRVVVTEWPEVRIQGGTFFPDPTLAVIEGASMGGSCLRVGWIGAGLLLEIRSGGRHITTSPVLAITSVQALNPAVH